ncbi:hypothetical protein C8R44DRAFT_754503 [Mycena epipterygia]|nr:hypothetical protein C8R44DRAFT_754503 [Mycena epipterygia]
MFNPGTARNQPIASARNGTAQNSKTGRIVLSRCGTGQAPCFEESIQLKLTAGEVDDLKSESFSLPGAEKRANIQHVIYVTAEEGANSKCAHPAKPSPRVDWRFSVQTYSVEGIAGTKIRFDDNPPERNLNEEHAGLKAAVALSLYKTDGIADPACLRLPVREWKERIPRNAHSKGHMQRRRVFYPVMSPPALSRHQGVDLTGYGLTPHLICEGATDHDTHPPCEPRPSDLCMPSVRLSMATHAVRPTKRFSLRDTHPPLPIRVCPGSRRIPVAVPTQCHTRRLTPPRLALALRCKLEQENGLDLERAVVTSCSRRCQWLAVRTLTCVLLIPAPHLQQSRSKFLRHSIFVRLSVSSNWSSYGARESWLENRDLKGDKNVCSGPPLIRT